MDFVLMLMKVELPACINFQSPSVLIRNLSGLAQPFIQCVLYLFGPLATFKLHVRTYGGREDKDMKKLNLNVEGSGVQKSINLLETFFTKFIGRFSHRHHGFRVHGRAC